MFINSFSSLCTKRKKALIVTRVTLSVHEISFYHRKLEKIIKLQYTDCSHLTTAANQA